MDTPGSVENKRPKAGLTPLAATLTKNGEVPAFKPKAYLPSPLLTSLPLYFLPSRAALGVRMEGQRAKTEVVRPPRGVNSPRTTHHSGRTAATMSWRILLTAFS